MIPDSVWMVGLGVAVLFAAFALNRAAHAEIALDRAVEREAAAMKRLHELRDLQEDRDNLWTALCWAHSRQAFAPEDHRRVIAVLLGDEWKGPDVTQLMRENNGYLFRRMPRQKAGAQLGGAA